MIFTKDCLTRKYGLRSLQHFLTITVHTTKQQMISENRKFKQQKALILKVKTGHVLVLKGSNPKFPIHRSKIKILTQSLILIVKILYNS